MVITYSRHSLMSIKNSLSRRPFIAPNIFNRIKELTIFRSYRGKGLNDNTRQNQIPVRITNRHLPSAKVQNRLGFRFISSKQHVADYSNLVPVTKLTVSQTLKCGLVNSHSVRNKSSAICDLIHENHLVCLALTETWLSANDEDN